MSVPVWDLNPPQGDAVDVAIVGAGPCGLAAAIAAKQSGLTARVFDRGPVVGGIASYPTYMTFFSTCDRLSIGEVPFILPTARPTRREALAYYRGVADHYRLDVRQYQRVDAVLPQSSRSSLELASGLKTRWNVGSWDRFGVSSVTQAHAVIVATGYFGRPNRLGIPGGDLPHVRHGYTEGHFAWRQDVLVVGGGNSAVDAALAMHAAGARVTMVHFREELDPGVKPWVRPEINARIADGSIRAYFNSRVVSIEPGWAVIAVSDAGGEQQTTRIRATQVHEMTGFLPEIGLLEALGVPVDSETGIPEHDASSMATRLPGIYLAGVIASGNNANRIFIENGRDHGTAIIADILHR